MDFQNVKTRTLIHLGTRGYLRRRLRLAHGCDSDEAGKAMSGEARWSLGAAAYRMAVAKSPFLIRKQEDEQQRQSPAQSAERHQLHAASCPQVLWTSEEEGGLQAGANPEELKPKVLDANHVSVPRPPANGFHRPVKHCRAPRARKKQERPFPVRTG